MRMAAIQSLSRRYHEGVLDEDGQPYLEFVHRVADRVVGQGGDKQLRAAALLLGVTEHSYATADELRAQGVPAAVAALVDAADRRPFESVEHHLRRLRRSRKAMVLKRAETLQRLTGQTTGGWTRRQRACLLAALDAELASEPVDVRPLIAALDDSTTDQWYAAELLGRLRAAEAVTPLARGVERLGSDRRAAELRSHFVGALGRIMAGAPDVWLWSRATLPPDPQWRPTLEVWSGHASAELRQLAVTLLGRLRDPDDTGWLVASLDDPDSRVAAAAALALGRATPPPAEVTDRLRGVLADTVAEPLRRATAARAVGSLADSRSVAELVRALNDKAGMVRVEAARALTRLSGSAVVADLRRVLRDRSVGASEAAWVLGQMRAVGAVDDLVHGLTADGAEHYLLWDRCAEALGKIGSPEGVAGLVSAFHARHAPARVIWALGRIDVDSALDVVLAASYDTNRELRTAAVRALASSANSGSIPRLIELCDEPYADLAARGLLHNSDARAIPTLVHVLATTRDRRTRRLAGRALARLQPNWSQLSVLLYPSPDVQLRRIQAWLFGYVGDDANPTGVPTRRLTDLLGDRDERVRAHAAASLGRRREAAATASLVRALSDLAPRVRANAATALGLVGDAQCREALTMSASDPHKDVQCAAAAALRHLP
jgi:HEAT repeat protein